MYKCYFLGSKSQCISCRRRRCQYTRRSCQCRRDNSCYWSRGSSLRGKCRRSRSYLKRASQSYSSCSYRSRFHTFCRRSYMAHRSAQPGHRSARCRWPRTQDSGIISECWLRPESRLYTKSGMNRCDTGVDTPHICSHRWSQQPRRTQARTLSDSCYSPRLGRQAAHISSRHRYVLNTPNIAHYTPRTYSRPSSAIAGHNQLHSSSPLISFTPMLNYKLCIATQLWLGPCMLNTDNYNLQSQRAHCSLYRIHSHRCP